MARSNRQLTQFAVDRLRSHLVNPVPGRSTAGNTEVELEKCKCCPERPDHIVVRLFGKEIFRAYTNPLNGRTIVGIQVKTGNFYDGKGRPSRTTRERLNGILDALGSVCVLPEGVRVFFNENGECCLGKGQACVNFDSTRSAVILMADSSNIIFK